MTALTKETSRTNLNPRRTRLLAPLPLEDTVKAWKGGLAGYYFRGATKGEVAPMKLSADMVGIGRFMETVDNASDGESVKIEAGEFVWSNGSSSDAIALANLGEPAFGADDDKVGLEGFDNATAVARVLTITPTAANDTPFSLGISYKKAGSREWRSTTIGMLSDATGTATEICDGLRADLLLRDDLDGLLVGTGTSTLILTGAKGFNFYVVSAGTGICAVATTAAGTLANRSQAGIITGFDSKGPQVWSDPSIYGLGF